MPEEEINKIIEEISPYYRKKKESAEEHKLVYDSSSETLEPVYFWIVDFMTTKLGGKMEKLIDSFTSSPGSGHFQELGQRATAMQQQAYKIMGDINTVLKSILNLIYDLREFQLRLSHYKAANSKAKEEKDAGFLALKQIWMDSVDMKRGQGSINALASGNLNFVTLRDAFMAAKDAKDVDDMDLNDRVKRILKPRIKEFEEWKKRSEIELGKRYEIEKTYLKTQVNSVKLYSRWARPYLRAAEQLRMMEKEKDVDLVNIFNTVLLELAIISKTEIDIQDELDNANLPADFKKIRFPRKYYACVLADFHFRGIPQRMPTQQSHYTFGGKSEVTFRAYALNEHELEMLNQKLEQSDLKYALSLVEGMTEESLSQIEQDIDEFLKEDEKEKKSEDTNPFLALIGHYKEKPEKKKEEEKEEKKTEILKVKADNYAESVVRAFAEQESKERCFLVFDVYKKAHAMLSHPSPY